MKLKYGKNSGNNKWLLLLLLLVVPIPLYAFVPSIKNYIDSLIMKKDFSNKSLPRGVRNNNFGNIKINPSNDWKGRVSLAENSDGVFEQFKTPEYGARAMMKTLLTYNKKYALDTVERVINRWAPPFDAQLNTTNPTRAYIDNVAASVGVSSKAPLDFSDKDLLISLAYAIARFENANHAQVTRKVFEDAYKIL